MRFLLFLLYETWLGDQALRLLERWFGLALVPVESEQERVVKLV